MHTPRKDDPIDLELRPLAVGLPADHEIQFPEAGDDKNLGVDKLDADTPGVDNKPMLRRDWFSRRCEIMFYLSL